MSILAGRIALITGASQGIGRACALELARAGASVALAARNLDKLAEVAAEIAAAGGTTHAFALDVASEESIKDCAKAVIAHFGGVNILVNNAGITRDILALRMKRKDWDDVLTTNLTGAFFNDAGRHVADGQEPLGTNYQCYVGRRRDRAGRPGELCGLQSWPDRIDKIARSRAGEPIDHGKRGSSRVYRNSDDLRLDRGAKGVLRSIHSIGTCRN